MAVNVAKLPELLREVASHTFHGSPRKRADVLI
jgi:hypothetical protein